MANKKNEPGAAASPGSSDLEHKLEDSHDPLHCSSSAALRKEPDEARTKAALIALKAEMAGGEPLQLHLPGFTLAARYPGPDPPPDPRIGSQAAEQPSGGLRCPN